MTGAPWTIIVNDECDPVMVTIIPPRSEPHEPVIFYDYEGTYTADERRSRAMSDIWTGRIIAAKFPTMRRVPGDAPVYRLVNDKMFVWVVEVMVEAR